jgi:branched-chain amino acid transport system ATP-binding protein
MPHCRSDAIIQAARHEISFEAKPVNALILNGVSKRFGGLEAVRDVHMDIPHGGRRALIGPNGAGKTTLFNLIAGDLPVTAGHIVVFGKDVTRIPPYRRVKLGLRRTYQTSALFDSLTVSQNLYLGVLGPSGQGHFNMTRLAARDQPCMERVQQVAGSVRLSDRLEAKAGDLSHGERRQLEIGLAIAYEPRLIMLDEPAAGLSADERRVIVGLMNGLSREITLLLIEHDMDVALNIGEQVTVLNEGAIIAEGTPAEISANALVQEVYLGGSIHD